MMFKELETSQKELANLENRQMQLQTQVELLKQPNQQYHRHQPFQACEQSATHDPARARTLRASKNGPDVQSLALDDHFTVLNPYFARHVLLEVLNASKVGGQAAP